jgi:sugar phosphate isomerase/epimerase
LRDIDLWPRIHGTQREEAEELGPVPLKKLLNEFGVSVSVTTRYDLGPFNLGDEILFTGKLGGDLIVTGSESGASTDAAEMTDRIARFAESLKPQLHRAEDFGVRIAIENHGGDLICSPESIRRLAELTQGLPLGIALAPYHLEQDPNMIAALIRDIGDRLFLFYAWQHGKGCMKPLPPDDQLMQMPGRGPMDFTPILRGLKATNYQGWTEVLMHPTPRGVPILDTPEATTAEITSAIRYLDGLLEAI